MIRKFNYTGRKKIERENVNIRLIKDRNPHPYFDFKLNVDPDDFPGNADVYVEAYDRSSFMRFKCGTLKNIVLPEERHLNGIHSTDSIHFRVKIVDPLANHGRILASADRLSSVGESQEDSEHITLLSVVFEDLGKEIWKLDFRDPGPVLILNNTFDSVNITETLRTSDLFFSLVYPQVLREILVRILIIDELSEEEDPRLWQNLWLAFAENLPDVPKIRGTYEIENPSTNQDFFLRWIDLDVLPAFCRKFSVKEKFESEIGRI